MSNTTLTNIPSNLDIRVKEPSGGTPPPSGVGPGSPDRFIYTKILFNYKKLFKLNLNR